MEWQVANGWQVAIETEFLELKFWIIVREKVCESDGERNLTPPLERRTLVLRSGVARRCGLNKGRQCLEGCIPQRFGKDIAKFLSVATRCGAIICSSVSSRAKWHATRICLFDWWSTGLTRETIRSCPQIRAQECV